MIESRDLYLLCHVSVWTCKVVETDRRSKFETSIYYRYLFYFVQKNNKVGEEQGSLLDKSS